MSQENPQGGPETDKAKKNKTKEGQTQEIKATEKATSSKALNVLDANETGYGKGYQDSVKIESRVFYGLEPDEFYRYQVGLVLDKIPKSLEGGRKLTKTDGVSKNMKVARAGFKRLKTLIKAADIKFVDKVNLNLGPGKKVLELGVGEGDTSRLLSATGADVVATDLSTYLIHHAKERDKKVRANLKPDQKLGNIDYKKGDMGDIKNCLDSKDPNQFDAVTCLSRSFIYLLTREKYLKALKDYFELLKPGGKFAVQMRQHINLSDYPWNKDKQITTEDYDESMSVRHKSTGTMIWKTNKTSETEDKVKVTSTTRTLIYPDGKKLDLGEIVADDYMRLENLHIMADLLRQAGFVNIGFKAKYLNSDDSECMYVLVAEKPSN